MLIMGFGSLLRGVSTAAKGMQQMYRSGRQLGKTLGEVGRDLTDAANNIGTTVRHFIPQTVNTDTNNQKRQVVPSTYGQYKSDSLEKSDSLQTELRQRSKTI